MEQVISSDKRYLNIIKVLSFAIPVVVAILIFVPQKLSLGSWVKLLPHINAVINSLTSVFLLLAVYFIKKGNIRIHKQLMSYALVLGSLFLVSYVLYHSSVPSTKFGDINHDGVVQDSELTQLGSSRTIYLAFLLSHIGLSIVVVPFVLLAFYYSLSAQIDKHKKIVRFTFPIWLYVSVTGVIVYFMISPYYA